METPIYWSFLSVACASAAARRPCRKSKSRPRPLRTLRKPPPSYCRTSSGGLSLGQLTYLRKGDGLRQRSAGRAGAAAREEAGPTRCRCR